MGIVGQTGWGSTLATQASPALDNPTEVGEKPSPGQEWPGLRLVGFRRELHRKAVWVGKINPSSGCVNIGLDPLGL